MDVLRHAFTLANCRRMGMDEELAKSTGSAWMGNFNELFRQDRANQFFADRRPDASAIPANPEGDCIFLTAHYSGYTALLIATSKRCQRDVSVVIGNHPQAFVDMLTKTCNAADVDVAVIRSGMRMLRQIRQAVEQGRIVFGLFDVPWHRTDGAGRELTKYPLGSGSIVASDAMFELSRRLGLRTDLVLCARRESEYVIRYEAGATQARCYEVLAEEVALNPGDYERLCEMHKYYDARYDDAEAVFFGANDRHFALSAKLLKLYEFDMTSPELRDAVSANDQHAAKLDVLEKVSGVRHTLLEAL